MVYFYHLWQKLKLILAAFSHFADSSLGLPFSSLPDECSLPQEEFSESLTCLWWCFSLCCPGQMFTETVMQQRDCSLLYLLTLGPSPDFGQSARSKCVWETGKSNKAVVAWLASLLWPPLHIFQVSSYWIWCFALLLFYSAKPKCQHF